MQWIIQMKDKQIAVISEKLSSHLVLFNLVEKEVPAVKQVLGDVHCLVGEKESVDTIMITPGTCILPSSGNFILIIIFPCFSDVYSLCIIVPFTVISVCDLEG